ncbi:MAG: S1 RNA-binding domain-containing protein, partial [Planctomycetes bacterium]|nr:S1 RNA-binding domain-containing protein [Planctomycetota bacterium]
VDKENEKVSLGLKQKTSSPWEDVEANYPIGTKVKGIVVNVMKYGVFVRLKDGIEGLIHISEMSWTKRLKHPNEMLNLGDEVDAVVLSVNREKQEISLGLKQTETNPWTIASQKYPQGTVVTVNVRSLTNFGAFVEMEHGIDGMIHISDLSWTRKYNHPSEALQKDQKIECVVLEVDEERQRVSLGVKQLTEDPWLHAIPGKYIPGHIIKGKVTKLTNFGAFVELEPELEGLLHISELADHKIDEPADIVKEGNDVEVKILKVDTEARKIGLSLRRAQWAAEENEDAPESAEPAKEKQGPVAVQTVLSNLDVDNVTKSQAETEEKPADEEKPAVAVEVEEAAKDGAEEKPTVEETKVEEPAKAAEESNAETEETAGADEAADDAPKE